MTGRFAEKDPRRCAHYAGFMAGLNLTQANCIFWILFLFVLVLMCISSLQHHKSINLTDVEKGLTEDERNDPKHRRRVRRLRKHYLSIVALCFIFSATSTVIEVFAAFNIEYCDGEDLMQLYWSFWSILQVGSNIAILGVMLQLWIVLGNHENPSWAVALGTPVLVFAAFGWLVRQIWKQTWARMRRTEVTEAESGDEDDELKDSRWTLEKWDLENWIRGRRQR